MSNTIEPEQKGRALEVAAPKALITHVPALPPEQVDTIEVFPRGVKTCGYSPRSSAGLPEGSGGQRGIIKGWSPESRRRFREWLLTHESRTKCFGLTLTIPGEVISSDVWHNILHRLSQKCSRARVGLVWRLETQKRGQAHLHCIATSIGKKRVKRACACRALPADEKAELVETLLWWRLSWAKIVDEFAPKCAGRIFDGQSVIEVTECPRSLLLGADQHMVDLSPDSGGSIWWRYLCDHATKSKQEQLCSWSGVRHWGRINAAAFKTIEPTIWTVERRTFSAVYRWIRSSTRRRIKDDRCSFGSRKGESPRKNCAGSSVWFGVSPSVVEKLLSLASDNLAGAGSALDPDKALKRLAHDARHFHADF